MTAYTGRLRVGGYPQWKSVGPKAQAQVICRPREAVILQEISVFDLVLVELRVGRCPVEVKEHSRNADTRVYTLTEASPVSPVDDVVLILENPHDHDACLPCAEFEIEKGS